MCKTLSEFSPAVCTTLSPHPEVGGGGDGRGLGVACVCDGGGVGGGDYPGKGCCPVVDSNPQRL